MQEKSCSSMVIFTLGSWAFRKFFKNGFHSNCAKQNFPSSKFLLLLVFKSNLRNLMIFKNLQRGIVALNKGHPQDLSYILFMGKVLPPITPRATISPISLSSSSNVTVQPLFPVTRCASKVVHFRIFFNVSSLKKMRSEERGLPRKMLDVKYDVGPARILTMLCCCNRSVVTWEETERRQWDLSLLKRISLSLSLLFQGRASSSVLIGASWCVYSSSESKEFCSF